MLYKDMKFDKNLQICPVEQANCPSVSDMIATGVVPLTNFKDDYSELDHSQIYGRPRDVFEALGMQKQLIAAGHEAAVESAAGSGEQKPS